MFAGVVTETPEVDTGSLTRLPDYAIPVIAVVGGTILLVIVVVIIMAIACANHSRKKKLLAPFKVIVIIVIGIFFCQFFNLRHFSQICIYMYMYIDQVQLCSSLKSNQAKFSNFKFLVYTILYTLMQVCVVVLPVCGFHICVSHILSI